MRIALSALLLCMAGTAQAQPAARITCALPPQLTYDVVSSEEGPSFLLRRFVARFHGTPETSRFEAADGHCSNGVCLFRFVDAQGRSIDLSVSQEGRALEVFDEAFFADFVPCGE